MSKPLPLRLAAWLGMLGLAVTVVIVVYQLLTGSYLPQPMSDPLFLAFVILCPPSLLSIPIIDAETGTGAFYALWAFIGLMNAVLYGTIGAVFGYVRYLWKSNTPTSN